MVRRRHTEKASSLRKKPRTVNRSDSKLKRWETADDIPLDEEDQFESSRDKILLEGKGDNLDDLDDDEVFALNGLPDDNDSDDDDAEEAEDFGVDEDTEDLPSKSKSSRGEASKQKKQAQESSDESESDEDSEEETWGTKQSAFYNADEVESDDEEALELEEQEARRLQAKARADLTEEHFGLLDSAFQEDSQDSEEIDITSDALSHPLPTDKAALLRHLEKTDPESLALARDWSDTIANLAKTKERMANPEEHPSHPVTQAMFHLYYQALQTYSSLLAFYIYLRSQPKYASNPKILKSHPILGRLLTLKQSLNMFEEEEDQLDIYGEDDEDFDDDELLEDPDEIIGEDEGSEDFDELMEDANAIWSAERDGSVDEVEPDELQALYQEAMEASKKKKKKTAPKALEVQDVMDVEGAHRPKKKRKTSEKANEPVFDLVEPEFYSSTKQSSRNRDPTADSFGESTSLSSIDAADKSARRKSLKFHTSRIESTSAKRRGARNAALGGDDDIPYRERQKEKEDRKAKEAAARVAGQGGEELDNTEPGPRPNMDEDTDMLSGGSGGSDDESGGYYDLVKKSSEAKKEKKKADYDSARAAERVVQEDGATGPRSLSRAILANKGLTPHRSKSVRNPRVKKRQRFDQAKKKLSSQKATYKGGLSSTGGKYEGEKSGISRVVKSTKLV